ncbi:MAG: polysaccharide deacetylase family protein [Phycisphaerales bacterium]
MELTLGITGLVIACAVAVVYALPLAIKGCQVRDLRRRSAGRLVLTYDDGPGRSLTDAVLEILDGAGARGTFFMVGETAEADPDRAQRIVDAGHEAGCHSMAHLHAWKTAPWRSLADARAGFRSLSRWLGDGAMYRPPYGKVTMPTVVALARRGSRFAWWTHDSGDTHLHLPDPGRVVEQVEADGGGVVLLHDFEREVDREERHAFVLEVTRRLLALAERRGLRIVTMGELWRPEGGEQQGSAAAAAMEATA